MKPPVLIAIVVLVALLAGGGALAGAYFFLLPQVTEAGNGNADAAEDEEGEPEALKRGEGPAQYFSFAKPLLITLDNQGDAKYLQLAFSVLVRHEALVAALQEDEPLLRNDLIVQLGAEDPDSLRTPEGREALRNAILDIIRARTPSYVDEDTRSEFLIEDVLLSNLVMQ